MSVTSAKGFSASGISAGLKQSGNADIALVVNHGPTFAAAAVFTKNRFAAAPVLWSQQVLKSGHLKAVVLNSGGANACTGPGGFADTHHTAEAVANSLDIAPIEVAVCSTGLIGERLPMQKILAGVQTAKQELSATGGQMAATAIMTTDTVAKTAEYETSGWRIGGMAKGAGMLAPGLATMLVVITTDALVDYTDLQQVLTQAVELTFNRIDSDGCMSTNDTVLLMSSGASGVTPNSDEFSAGLLAVCTSLSRQLIADAEGATKDIEIEVIAAASETDALEVARAVSRSNLLKCAIHGEDPNWGRILSAVGTTAAEFRPEHVDVSLNGVAICIGGEARADRSAVNLKPREVQIQINLHAGLAAAKLWTNDLSALYVHENSAYSS